MVQLDPNQKFSVSSLTRRLCNNHNIGWLAASTDLMHAEEKLWEKADGKSDEFSAPRCYVQAYNLLERAYSIKESYEKRNKR